jgi:hypothetical protein
MSSIDSVRPIGTRLNPFQVAHLQETAAMARDNLQRAVDLVIVHEGYSVRGPEPPAALNEPTVLIAVAAWDRFTDDLWALAKDLPWQGPGRHTGQLNYSYLVRPRNKDESAGPDETLPGDAARVLAGLLGTTEPLRRFSVRLVYDWRGAEPRFIDANGVGLRMEDYRRPAYPDEPWQHLTIGEVVYQAVKLRNAVAHSYLPKMGDVVLPGGSNTRPEDTHWLNNPAHLFWASDKKDGISVQAGCARGVVALFIQLIDQCIVALAGVLTNQDDKAALLASRLPAEWFWRTHPAGSRRGVDWDVPLWRWQSLKRLMAEDFW